MVTVYDTNAFHVYCWRFKLSLFLIIVSYNVPSGKFTAPSVDPLFTYLTRADATSMPIMDCASSVDPPICGVSIVFGHPINSFVKPGPFENGSTGNTSFYDVKVGILTTAAPPRWPDFNAFDRAGISTIDPREAFMRYEPGFINIISLSPIICIVSEVSGTFELNVSRNMIHVM